MIAPENPPAAFEVNAAALRTYTARDVAPRCSRLVRRRGIRRRGKAVLRGLAALCTERGLAFVTNGGLWKEGGAIFGTEY